MITSARHWEDYIGSKGVYRRDTALFPMLDSDPFPERDLILAERFRWLASTYDDDTDLLFERWCNAEDHFLEERLAHSDIPLEKFHDVSVNLTLVMAQRETTSYNLNYYLHLRDELRLRPPRRGYPVLAVGPTFGAELEAVHAAGGLSYLVGDPSPWRDICEERLFHCRVQFENLSTSELLQNPVNSRYVIISPWSPDPNRAVLTAYNAMGESGFVLFPDNNASLCGISEKAGLRRVDSRQPTVAVFFKHPGLEVSLEHVHLET